MTAHLFNNTTGFTDTPAKLVAQGNMGKGHAKLDRLPQAMTRFDYPLAALSGLYQVADATALAAITSSVIAATVALEGFVKLRVRCLDYNGNGAVGLFEWNASSEADASALVVVPDDSSGAGRWILLSGENAIGQAGGPAPIVGSDENPGATSDESQGLSVNFLWRNNLTGEIFICTDATADAAVWKTVRPAIASYSPAAAAKRVTATTTKTSPSGLTIALPANVPAGARIKGEAQFKVVGSNGADEGAFSVETSDGAVLSLYASYDLVNSDLLDLKFDYTVQTTGASAALSGSRSASKNGTAAALAPQVDLSANLSAARTVAPYIQLNSTDPGNTVDVRRFYAEVWTYP